MKVLLALVLGVVSVHATAPADWYTCKVAVGKVAVQTIDEENMRWSSWPSCHVKLYQSPQSDTFFIYKDKKQLWWESYGAFQQITDGFYQWLPETQLEISVTGDILTLKIGENALEGMYGVCKQDFNSRDPPCVEAWGVSGGPPIKEKIEHYRRAPFLFRKKAFITGNIGRSIDHEMFLLHRDQYKGQYGSSKGKVISWLPKHRCQSLRFGRKALQALCCGIRCYNYGHRNFTRLPYLPQNFLRIAILFGAVQGSPTRTGLISNEGTSMKKEFPAACYQKKEEEVQMDSEFLNNAPRAPRPPGHPPPSPPPPPPAVSLQHPQLSNQATAFGAVPAQGRLLLTLKMGENALGGMYGVCRQDYNSRDPPCVEAWGLSGGPP